MRPNVARLSAAPYDVVVIGGGIYGLFAAWDASLRGLSVALVERGDFGAGTSFNSLRVIHGGLRYLQHGDLRRMRESIRERTTMMRIAPHLVHPMPFLIPTYGYGMRGKAALSLALRMHDILGFDRNRLDDPQKHLPASWTMSREECLRLFPEMRAEGLTGAAVFYDCQVQSSERLIIGLMRSALDAGAELANYVEATGFLIDGQRVAGITAKDTLSGDEAQIRGRVVINAAGPGLDNVLALLNDGRPRRKLALSKAFNVLISRRLTEKYAFGIQSRRSGRSGGGRGPMFFVTPCHGGSLIGTEHLPYDGDPDSFEVREEELSAFLEDVNDAYPAAAVSRDEVACTYAGLLPTTKSGTRHVDLLRHYQIVDHRKREGPEGLISLVGVKLTESRLVAQKAVDLACRQLRKAGPKSATSVTPVHGGHLERFDAFMAREVSKRPHGLAPEDVRHLIHRYGTAYPEVLEYIDENRELSSVPPLSSLVRAQVIHSVRREMAQRLGDVIFRRTALGVFGLPAKPQIEACASIMADELRWDDRRKQAELEALGVASPLEVRAR